MEAAVLDGCWRYSSITDLLLLHFILELVFEYETLCIAIYRFARPLLKLNDMLVMNKLLWFFRLTDFSFEPLFISIVD